MGWKCFNCLLFVSERFGFENLSYGKDKTINV